MFEIVASASSNTSGKALPKSISFLQSPARLCQRYWDVLLSDLNAQSSTNFKIDGDFTFQGISYGLHIKARLAAIFPIEAQAVVQLLMRM